MMEGRDYVRVRKEYRVYKNETSHRMLTTCVRFAMAAMCLGLVFLSIQHFYS